MTLLEDLGRYRVLEPIGRGGMGVVFAGEHSTLRLPVAIKVLHPHLVGDATMVRRMVDEAHTMAAVRHPGIVAVLDVGTTLDGRTYVVMERLVGEPLSDRLRRGRLREACAVAFARQLAAALACTHAAGIVHRDLKPENVFVVPDAAAAAGERVKLLDFGIAKRDVDGREPTKTGVVLGTPAYMAPEQSEGGHDVDARTDVYALGVVAYHMVTGTLPFAGTNTADMMAEHAFCAPRPPSAIAPVSAALSAIIERCLAKRPSERFATMAALDEALAGLATAEAPTLPGQAGFDDDAVPRRRLFGDDEPTSPDERAAGGRDDTSTSRIAITLPASASDATRWESGASRAPAASIWMLASVGAAGLGLAAALLVRVLSPQAAAPVASPSPVAVIAVPAARVIMVAEPPVASPVAPRRAPEQREDLRRGADPRERDRRVAAKPQADRDRGQASARASVREPVATRPRPRRASGPPATPAPGPSAPTSVTPDAPAPAKEPSFATVEPPTLY